MNRRNFLTIAGGGVILAAGAGAAGFLTTRTPNAALAPWRDAGVRYNDPRRRAAFGVRVVRKPAAPAPAARISPPPAIVRKLRLFIGAS